MRAATQMKLVPYNDVPVVNDHLPCSCYTSRLDVAAKAINDANLLYLFLGGPPGVFGNSNGALFEWLYSINHSHMNFLDLNFAGYAPTLISP